jgi:hypothetical protein
MLDWLFVGFLEFAATTVTRVYPRHPLGRRIKVNTRPAAGAPAFAAHLCEVAADYHQPLGTGPGFARRAASLV